MLPVWFEVASLGGMVVILAADLALAFARPRVPSTKESTVWVVLYIALALLFALGLLIFANSDRASEFVAGWVTEYSLSVDNLFVFVIIMARFSVPKRIQQEVLMVGILIALVLRGLFIVLGAQLIENVSWIFYIFGAFLLFTSVQQILSSTETMEETESGVIRFLRKRIAISNTYDGAKLRTTRDGRRMFTPVLVVFIAIGTTDLVFALDSIPAIFGITTDPFIVFAANIFALMGLRQLYFLLGSLIDKLVYLKYGIAIILAFIGVKLVFHAMHTNEVAFVNGGHSIEWAPEISTWTSLAVIVVAMAIATIASLIRLRIQRPLR